MHRHMLALTEGARPRIAFTVALGLAISGTFIAQGVVVALVVSRILDGAPWTGALALVGIIAVLAAVRAVLLRWREVSSMLTAADVKVALRQRLYRALLALGPGYMERTRTGTVQSTLVDGVEALESLHGLLPAAVHRRGGRAPGRGGVHLLPQSPGGRGSARVRAGRPPGAAPVGRPAGRIRAAALAGLHGAQRPVRRQHAGDGHAQGA